MIRPRYCLGNLLVTCLGLLCQPQCWSLEADFRIKGFATANVLPSHDAQRRQLGTPSSDTSFDVRTILRHQTGQVNLLLDHAAVLFSGPAAELGGGLDSQVDQTVTEDDRRWVDLTWEIEDGNRHRSFHRLDRLAVQWQPGDWSVTFGRQAVSWGGGLVFQPLDLFSPFSPTVVDRDYKPGVDLLLVDRLLSNGQDLQLLHVTRRDEEGDVTSGVSSTALKWHGFAGRFELETVVARHFDETVLGFSWRTPVGQALMRSDIVATRLQDGAWRVSGMLNADVTFVVAQRNAYAFVEYFHNNWGVRNLPPSAAALPIELQDRLARGELFNVSRDYLAVGGNYEWHPLLSQSVTLISNLHDSSSLAQIQFSYEPGDHLSLQVGWIEPLGRLGDEFGGITLGADPLGNPLSAGGASRGYLRWVYFF